MTKTYGIGAGNETRTRDPDLGKVVLYQLSYSRFLERAVILGRRTGKSRNSLAGKPFFRKDSHYRSHRIRVAPAPPAFGRDEALRNRVIEHGVQRVEIALDVGEHHGFGVQPQLRPGDDFHQFVE